MTGGLFFDEDEGTQRGATDAAEHGQQTGLTRDAALHRMQDLGCDPRDALTAIRMTVHSADGIVVINGIRVSYAEGYGYAVERGPGPVPPDALFTVKPGVMLTIEWSGELRTVICDRITEYGAVIRDLTEAEQLDLDRQAYDEFLAAKREAGQ